MFLRDVVRVVPFYRERLGATPDDALSLSAFPIVRRSQLVETPEQFLIPASESETRSITPTNGTIGSPLAVHFDAVGWHDLNYGTYAVLAEVYPDLLSRMTPRADGVFLVNNNPWSAEISVYVPPLQLAVLRQLVLGRSADKDAALVAQLRASPVPLLYGKASNLVTLAGLDAAADGDRIRPGAILVSGEALYDDQRQTLERWFGCPVINAYIATEGGLIALECPHKTGMHVCEDRVRLEVLTRDAGICPTGTGQVLLTNLMNRGHVFIRYLLGDEVELTRGACPCGFEGTTVTALHGRESKHLVLPDGPVAATTFEQFLLGLPLKEFQLYQVDGAPPWLKWVPAQPDAESLAAIAQGIDDWLRARGWADAVASIPLGRITPPGGKHRRCVRVERVEPAAPVAP
ncbi:MAG: hypothetical protein H7138_15205 [Myxococcales bacterium]|nr:hypothetical protein [Myxococcales bacterium]